MYGVAEAAEAEEAALQFMQDEQEEDAAAKRARVRGALEALRRPLYAPPSPVLMLEDVDVLWLEAQPGGPEVGCQAATSDVVRGIAIGEVARAPSALARAQASDNVRIAVLQAILCGKLGEYGRVVRSRLFAELGALAVELESEGAAASVFLSCCNMVSGPNV
jgi:hypothetical protein